MDKAKPQSLRWPADSAARQLRWRQRATPSPSDEFSNVHSFRQRTHCRVSDGGPPEETGADLTLASNTYLQLSLFDPAPAAPWRPNHQSPGPLQNISAWASIDSIQVRARGVSFVPVFQPDIEVIEGLPALSWLVDLGSRGRILAGPGVEVMRLPSGLCVFEGAWDDDFESCGFAAAPNFFGSGIVVDDEGVTFSTSSDTLESLYVLEDSRGALVSNSLSFLISFTGQSLRADRKIFKKILTIVKGTRDYDRILYDADGSKITRWCHCNFSIAHDQIRRTEKTEPPHFHSFRDYRSYLTRTLEKLMENATSPARKVQHRLLTTVSSGYDSAVGAALASVVGGKLALTIRTDRGGLVDSGKAVAEALGLECIEEERANLASYGEHAEAEFIVGGSGGDCTFLSFERHLAGSVLLTGFHGGMLWNLHSKPTAYITSKDDSGSGLHELRLRKGFIHVPVPFIAATRHPELHDIAHSEEMRPYRMGNDYDRPLARRMVEERGVPRQLFGQKKKASGFMFTTEEAVLPVKTQRAVDRLVRERFGLAIWTLERLHRVPRDLLNSLWRFATRRLSTESGQAADGIGHFMLKGCRVLSLRLTDLYGTLWPFDRCDDLLLIWALDKTGARYRKAGCKRLAQAE